MESLATRRNGQLALLALLALALPALAGGGPPAALPRSALAPRAQASPAAASPVAAAGRPNIVLVVADDLDAGSAEAMPAVGSLLNRQGVGFANAFASTPLCCPARVSILRGQYAHNHGVLGNGGPHGGFATFRRRGGEDSTVATWLQGAGYRTGLLGKYLNGYPEAGDPAYVPPGWDEWAAFAGGSPAGGGYFGYELNENGRLVAYGGEPADYSTDVLAAKATDFVGRAAASGEPFFLYVAPFAPHAPPLPAPRHAAAFADARAPRSPAFNEADVADKPAWVRDLPPLSGEQLALVDAQHRDRLRTLLALDDMVAALLAALEETGTLDDTYVVFTSDNGYHLGEHRLPFGKGTPYGAAARVPLLVRGPGVPAGRVVEELTLNADLAPTIAELAGAPVPGFVDGRSLVPLLGGQPPAGWRRAVLVESFGVIRGGGRETPRATPAAREEAEEGKDDEGGAELSTAGAPPYRALRTADLAYVEYAGGVRELYDLRADPHELANLAARADPALLARLAERLAALRGCAAATCRAAEDAPVDGIVGRAPMPAPAASPAARGAIEVTLRDGRGREVGRATLTETAGGVVVSVGVGALAPGEHGIHVHETGVCDPSGPPQFGSAGGHYDPTGAEHGGPPPAPGHAGDLGNIRADRTGFAELRLGTDRFGLAELRDADGSALVIHAARDDLTATRDGGSGQRIVCGVIAPPQGPPEGTPAGGTPAAGTPTPLRG